MRPFLLMLCGLLFTCSAWAQAPKSSGHTAAEAKAVETTVLRFFDAMRAGDTTAMRSFLAPNARLLSVGATKDGSVLPRETPINAFLKAVGQPHPQALDERIWGSKVEIDGDLATLWCQYAFYVGDQFSHCGADAFQLFRSPQGWKIFSIADTRRKENCDLPAGVKNKAKN